MRFMRYMQAVFYPSLIKYLSEIITPQAVRKSKEKTRAYSGWAANLLLIFSQSLHLCSIQEITQVLT